MCISVIVNSIIIDPQPGIWKAVWRASEENHEVAASALSRIETPAEKKEVIRGVREALSRHRKMMHTAMDLGALLIEMVRPRHAILFHERGLISLTAKTMRTVLRVIESAISPLPDQHGIIAFYRYAFRRGAPCSSELCLRAAAIGSRTCFLLAALEAGRGEAVCSDARIILRFLRNRSYTYYSTCDRESKINSVRTATVRAMFASTTKPCDPPLVRAMTEIAIAQNDFRLARVISRTATTHARLCMRLGVEPTSPLFRRFYDDNDDVSDAAASVEDVLIEGARFAQESVENALAPFLSAVRILEDRWIAYSYSPFPGRPGYERSLRSFCLSS